VEEKDFEQMQQTNVVLAAEDAMEDIEAAVPLLPLMSFK